METLITQDYEFVNHSLLYGQFLIECHETYPDIKFTDASKFYGYKPEKLFVSVNVPERLAVVLKLRFGHCLRIRPEINYDDEMLKEMTSMQILKSRNYIKEKYWDYGTYTKTVPKKEESLNIQKLEEMIKMIEMDKAKYATNPPPILIKFDPTKLDFLKFKDEE